jgi:hypothetical protein
LSVFIHIDEVRRPHLTPSKQLRAAKTLSLAARVPKPVAGPMEAGERLSAVLELRSFYHLKFRCHCEERSDEAISRPKGSASPFLPARVDGKAA